MLEIERHINNPNKKYINNADNSQNNILKRHKVLEVKHWRKNKIPKFKTHES